ncbi:hypothetical protein [Paraburkholderia sp. SIMBA_054]|uniref:hypothetical protein n=1 Tax=Paraburkholderia sp. SIMBA_054 TaxID=3085795 RepID=UPI00397DAC04
MSVRRIYFGQIEVYCAEREEIVLISLEDAARMVGLEFGEQLKPLVELLDLDRDDKAIIKKPTQRGHMEMLFLPALAAVVEEEFDTAGLHVLLWLWTHFPVQMAEIYYPRDFVAGGLSAEELLACAKESKAAKGPSPAQIERQRKSDLVCRLLDSDPDATVSEVMEFLGLDKEEASAQLGWVRVRRKLLAQHIEQADGTGEHGSDNSGADDASTLARRNIS